MSLKTVPEDKNYDWINEQLKKKTFLSSIEFSGKPPEELNDCLSIIYVGDKFVLRVNQTNLNSLDSVKIPTGEFKFGVISK